MPCPCSHRCICAAVFSEFPTTNVVPTTEISNIRTEVGTSCLFWLLWLHTFIKCAHSVYFEYRSNTSHPGYDVHYLIMYGMVLYTMLWISSDLLFFYFTMYIAFRYDLIQNLAAKLGDRKSEYGTPAKQTVLIRQIIDLHSDTIRFLLCYRKWRFTSLTQYIFRFYRKCSETYSLIVLFQAANFMLTAVICLTMFSIVSL